MQLAIDIGNTYIKAGLFSEDKLLGTIRFVAGEEMDFLNFIAGKKINYTIFSSVESSEAEAVIGLLKDTKIIQLDHNTPLPLINNYLSPETLGKDRLAGAIGAWVMSGGKSVLVIDAGTCIKYDFVDESQGYMGGSISPGLQMRLDAMHHFTARLPSLTLKRTTDFYGNDTFSAMMTGVVTGAVGECSHFIQVFKKRFGKFNVILTGGNADFLSLQLDNKYSVEPNLILTGLNSILNFNKNNDK